MDILWAAMAICAIVSVVFYVLAMSWQQTLKTHAGTIRALVQRLEAVEAMEDPMMRRRISELIPSPLEEVYILSFRLGERFWRDTAGLAEAQMRRLHEVGTFVGSVKIELWRSHINVTLRELPPRTQSADWQIRTIDIYTIDSGKGTVLWELDLESTLAISTQKPPALELRYENKAVVLAIRYATREVWNVGSNTGSEEERIIFRIPLDAEQLVQFRVSDTDFLAGIGSEREDTSTASFACQDEQQGVDWQLRLRSFNTRPSSGDWTILEPLRARRVS